MDDNTANVLFVLIHVVSSAVHELVHTIFSLLYFLVYLIFMVLCFLIFVFYVVSVLSIFNDAIKTDLFYRCVRDGYFIPPLQRRWPQGAQIWESFQQGRSCGFPKREFKALTYLEGNESRVEELPYEDNDNDLKKNV
ncbi:hypothetical protein F5Y09DRAFT_340926 [Xylaria sp. FL1042]|nr:hypothetical protein F5Y09DRAFT_340926 [Xylaria sp. FL1042]